MVVVLPVISGVAAAGAVAYRWLTGGRTRSLAAQAELDRAVARVDRELAANLELTTMFDQTRQAVVLENGQFELARAVLQREIPRTYAIASDVYARIPETEAAMERRGPARSLKEPDRLLIETWEGDARALQLSLRQAAAYRPAPVWQRLIVGARRPWAGR